jgi:hypothetical protein
MLHGSSLFKFSVERSGSPVSLYGPMRTGAVWMRLIQRSAKGRAIEAEILRFSVSVQQLQR